MTGLVLHEVSQYKREYDVLNHSEPSVDVPPSPWVMESKV